MQTANGVEITEGLRVWTYDLERGQVRLDGLKYADGWFTVQCDNGNRTMQNGERVATVHPLTGDAA